MRWYTVAVLTLIFALVFQLGLLAYAMYVLLAVLISSRFLTQTWIRSVAATRECNRLVAEIGDVVAVVVSLSNRSALPVAWLLVEDLLPRKALMFRPPNLQLQGRRMQLFMLRGHGTKRLMYQMRCNRRGYYQLGPTVVETGDLFGLHRRYHVATEPHFLLVYPRVIPLQGFDIASRRPIGEVRMTYRLYEDPTRIAGVRRYEPGDPLNRVHWRATARTGTLQSKAYEPSTVAGATLLLDFHRDSHAARHEPFRSELAVTAAASVANAIYEMGQQIGLVTNGRDAADRIRVEGWDYNPKTRQQARGESSMREQNERLQPLVVATGRGPDQIHHIFATLARIELTDGLDLGQLILETTSRMPRDATVITIMPRATNRDVVALQTLRRQGFAVAVILNVHDESDFAEASGPLQSVGIPTYHLKDEASITVVCQNYLLR